MSDTQQDRLQNRVRLSQLTAVFSVLFALTGFSYNVWRMEVTETNSNIRTACFEMLTELAELEQLIYAATYDQDPVEGNPRKGWVKVRLIHDLSAIGSPEAEHKAEDLQAVWAQKVASMAENPTEAEAIVTAIDRVREQIASDLRNLK